jgi:ABC-type sulfate transport system substrate-binding protein
VTTNAPESAKRFLGFITSDAGQKIFADHGFRPLNPSVKPEQVEGATDPSNPFPAVKKLATIDDLGGWSEVSKKFFDEENGIVTKIQDASGVA